MEKMMTVQEAAAKWQIRTSQVTRYCRQNRIPGAFKQGNLWLIPANASKPDDLRKENAAVNTAVTDKVIAGRKCNAYVLTDLPAGKYSEFYEKDSKNPAGKKLIKATVK